MTKMNWIMIVGLVIIVIVVIIIFYYLHDSNTMYTTSVNDAILYKGYEKPYVSSDDLNKIVIASGNRVDVFTSVGTKLGSIIINDVAGVAYNRNEEAFIAIDHNGNLYLLDLISFTATVIGNGYTSLYDTPTGYYIRRGNDEMVLGETNDKTPINGSYGMFDVITKVSR